MQGVCEETGETGGSGGKQKQWGGGGGCRMKVNVTSAGEQRGVFDLTNRDTKTLQLAAPLPLGCHCAAHSSRQTSRFCSQLTSCKPTSNSKDNTPLGENHQTVGNVSRCFQAPFIPVQLFLWIASNNNQIVHIPHPLN